MTWARPGQALAGACTGLLLARLSLEATGATWFGFAAVGLALGAAAVGALAALWLLSDSSPSIPLPSAILLCLPGAAYALWPDPVPSGGWVCLALSAAAWAGWAARNTSFELGRPGLDAGVAGILSMASLVLYWRTLAPSTLGADSGEFQFVPYVLGIAHPPGYPLYTMLGFLFSQLPLGSPAHNMNLMSAFFGAAAIGLLYMLIVEIGREIGRRQGLIADNSWLWRVAAILAALAFALTPTWWGQATVAAVRTLTGVFAVAIIWLAMLWWRTRDWRWLAAAGGAFTLGFTHHVSLVAAGLALLLLAMGGRFWRGLGWRRFSWQIAIALAPLIVYLYLPLRSLAGTPFDPAKPTTLEGFLDLVLARGFQGDMFHYGWADMPARLDLLWQLLSLQYNYLALSLAVMGFAYLVGWHRLAASALGATAVINTLMGITYRAPVIADYLIPSYLVLAVFIGIATAAIISAVARLWSRFIAYDKTACGAVVAALGIALLVPGAALFPSLDMSSYRDMEEFSRAALTAARPGAVILADWSSSTALWYYQLAEGQRPDVEVLYVHPEGDAVPWAKRVAEQLPNRPTYLSNYDPQAAKQFRLMPVGPLAEARTEPSFEPPPGIRTMNADLEGQIILVGYRLEEDRLRPGEILHLTIYWQAQKKIEKPYTVFVHLADAEGNVWGQRDGTPVRGRYPTDRWVAGEVIGDQYELLVLPTVPPGEYHLLAGMYETPAPGIWQRLTVSPDGKDVVELGRITVEPDRQRRMPLEYPLHARFGGRLELLGADIEEATPEAFTLTLLWRTLAAPGEDLIVSLSTHASQQEPQTRVLPSSDWEAGEIHSQLWTISTASGNQPAALDISVSASRGEALPAAGPWMLPLRHGARLVLDWPRLFSPRRVRANFGDQALLLDYQLSVSPVHPGGSVEVSTRWLPLWRIDEDYSLFVHLLDASGKVVSQRDATPVHGGLPTLRWAAGREITDRRTMQIPADLPPGDYWLQVGLYPITTGQRVPVLDQRRAKSGQGDRVLIGPLQVR